MEDIIYIIVTSSASAISGILVFMLKRIITKLQQKEIINEEEKVKENYLVLRSINALGKLTVANSIALRDGQTSSDFSNALSEYQEIEKEMYQYLISTHSRNVI